MNTNNIALRAAMVIALGTVPAITVAYSPGLPLNLASELVVPEGNAIKFTPGATYGINLDMKEFVNSTIGTNAPLEVKISLTNGATFKGVTASSLSCNYSGTTVKPADSLLNGADGDSLVTFKLPAGAFTASTTDATCQFTGGMSMTSGSKNGLATYGMVVSAYLNSVVESEKVKKTIEGSVVSFKQAFGTSVTPNEITIDVADPAFSQKFLAKSNVSEGKSAVLGTLQYKVVAADAFKVDNAGALSNVAGADLLPAGNLTITLSGTPLQAGAGGTTVSVGRGAGGIAACNDASPKNPSVSGVVSFSTVTPAEFVAGTTFCYKVDGATRIDKGLVTFDITAPTDPAKTPNITVVGEKTLATFYKNGTSVKILTIPDPTDLNNELNIRIYNMSSSVVKVYGSLYKTDGTVIGSKNTLLGSIDPNGVKVLKSGGPAPANLGLANLFTVTTWGGGRAWIQIEGDSQALRVQAIAKTAGTMVNMSDRVLEDNGTFKRSGTK